MNNSNDLLGTSDDNSSDLGESTWQLNALTEALGDLRLTVNDSLSVGRGSDNDVVLGSKQVSRNHALLSVLNGELYVKDLDSSNGTFVNDDRIENNKTKLLSSDDTVTFASFAFKVAKINTPLIASDNEQPIAENTTVLAATDTLAEPISSVDSDFADTNIDTDVTDIGAIDTGVMKNKVRHPEVAETDSVDKKVSDNNFVDSDVEASSVTSAALFNDNNNNNKNDITDAEIVDVEAVDNESADDVESAEKVDVKPVDTEFKEETMPVVNVINNESDKVSATLDDTSDITRVTNPTTSAPVDLLNNEDTIVTDSTNAPIVKQTIINDVLSASESANHKSSTAPVQTEAFSQDKDLLTSEPIVEVREEKSETLYQKPLVTPEHDKTTTTALQEEADPDILRAKQAATSQFSGTANLGQSRDVGTEGNNALDQAISNPATHHTNQKKPSGSWFIWVFIAIIIIGLALWLFNKGAV